MLNPPKQVPSQISEALRQADSVLIVSHVFPDGDALGSQLALGEILESLGKKVYYYCEEFVSTMYEFLPGSEKLKNDLPDISVLDAAVAVDCGDRFRVVDAAAGDRRIAREVAIGNGGDRTIVGDPAARKRRIA